jgi:hypothetical protein
MPVIHRLAAFASGDWMASDPGKISMVGTSAPSDKAASKAL